MGTDRIPGSLAECTLHNDPRLIAGAGALAGHMARLAGLPERAQEDLDGAIAEACRQAFQMSGRQGRGRATIHLAVARFPDRVEVAVEFSTAKRAAVRTGPRRGRVRAGRADRIATPPASMLVDRVERTTHDGRSRMTLVKYCGVAKSSSKR